MPENTDTKGSELVSMQNQFRGLPMGELIGAPLNAACDAQIRLAQATANFIQVVGFLPPDPKDASAAKPTDGKPNALATRTASFDFQRPVKVQNNDGTVSWAQQDVKLDVPLLAIVNVPALSIKTVDVTFDMEVKSSFKASESEDKKGAFSADGKMGWGAFSLSVHVEGSVATHKENTRTSDNSAKYHVAVHAEDGGMPEGLARVLDILHSAIVPVDSSPALPAKSS